MRSAPSLWEKCPTLVRSSRRLALLFALGLTAACSVYTSELVETTTGITNGGSETSGGKQNGAAGNSSSLGGKVAVEPSGGEGGDDANGGKAGETSGGTDSGTGGTAGTDPGVAGTAGTGGTTGTTGGTSPGGAGTGGTGTVTAGLLDGFEDEDLTLEQVDGRGGVWYLVGDGTTGTVAPSPLVCTPNSGAPVDLGGYAMHITATGFTGSGSLLGADLRNKKLVYNATKFTGIRFWAKVGTGKNTKHRVQISDSTTDAAGAKCVPASTVATEKCDDHFGMNMTFTTAWAQYTIPFAEMEQLGWGKPAAAITKTALYGFQVTAKPKMDVDLWLDQIEFF